MDRNVPAAFALLGLLLGSVEQVNNVVPSLLRTASPGTLGLGIVALGAVLFLLSTVGVVLVGYWAEQWVALPDEFVRFVAVAGVAGGVGSLVGGAVALLAAPVELNEFLRPAVVGVAYGAATESISIALYGFAGAAAAHFHGSRA